jgi:predicted N-acyltransferase
VTTLAAKAFHVTALTSTEDIAAARWDALASRGAHLHNWFLAAERCGWRARHVVIRSDEAARVIVPAYLVARMDHDLHDRWLGPLRRITAVVGVRLRPALTVGAPFVQTSSPLGPLDDVSDAALERTFDLLEERAREDGARAVVWPFLDPGCERIVRLGQHRGYAAVYAGASAFLPVEWDSLDTYLQSRSKNVRRTVRADLRALDIGGFRTEVRSDFGPHAAAVESLFHAFFVRRNGYRSMLPSGFFQGVAERADRGIVAQLTWQADQLVGASLNLIAGGVVDGTFATVAPGHEGGAVYYNDLVYTPIRIAARHNVRRLELGPTALYAKVLRGAKLRRRVTLIRGTTPRMHAVLRALGQRVAARTERKEETLLAPLGGFRCFE